MITCKSCGEPMQAGLATCQRCGMPLYSINQREMEPHKDFHGQTELPTWLESLRVDERSNPPVSDQSNFSMSRECRDDRKGEFRQVSCLASGIDDGSSN